MALDMVNYETRTRKAVRAFWHSLERDRPAAPDVGSPYPAEREGAGEHRRGFVDLVAAIVRTNGLENVCISWKPQGWMQAYITSKASYWRWLRSA